MREWIAETGNFLRSSNGVKPDFTWVCLASEIISYSDKTNIWLLPMVFKIDMTKYCDRLKIDWFVTSLFYVIEPTQPTLTV